MGGGKTAISYLSATLATHTQFQKVFSELIENNINPTDLVFSLTRTKIKTASGRSVNGYSIETTEESIFVKEKFRPSCFAKLSFKTINSGDFTGAGEVLEIKVSGSFE